MTEDCQRNINDCRDELTNIKTWINKNQLDSNVKYLVAYSVVRASGAIELVFKQMVYDFLSDQAKKETQYYLEKQIIDSSCNPNVNNMLRILEQVDTQRRTRFDTATRDTQEKRDLGSLVNLRNDIAHGRTNNPTINNIERYFESGVKVLNKLELVLASSTT